MAYTTFKVNLIQITVRFITDLIVQCHKPMLYGHLDTIITMFRTLCKTIMYDIDINNSGSDNHAMAK